MTTKKTSLLIMDSFTAAQRAVRYLNSLRINASVEKSASKGGCAYGVRVYDPPERAYRLLRSAGITPRRVVR